MSNLLEGHTIWPNSRASHRLKRLLLAGGTSLLSKPTSNSASVKDVCGVSRDVEAVCENTGTSVASVDAAEKEVSGVREIFAAEIVPKEALFDSRGTPEKDVCGVDKGPLTAAAGNEVFCECDSAPENEISGEGSCRVER